MNWCRAKLSEVADIERDGIASDAIATGTRYLGLEHIETGGRILGAATVEAGDLASTKFQFTRMHVLYGKLRPYLAKIATPDFDGICSTDIVPIMPGPRLDRSFLTHFLRQPSMIEFANSRTTGANLPRLSPKALAEFEIPLPPLEEQKRIAAFLDQADELRSKRQRALDRLNQLGQAIFIEMFGDPSTNPNGWPIEKAEKLADRITVGLVVRPASYYCDSGVPAIRGTNIKESGLNLSDVVYVSEKDNNTKLAKSRIWTNDIVIVRSGRPGLAAIVPPELNGSNAIDVLIFSPMKERVVPQFIRDLINSEGGKRLVLAESRGQVQQHFNVGSLSEAEFFVPPFSLQLEYQRRIRELQNQIARSLNAVQVSERLFSSLQNRAFRGELIASTLEEAAA